VEGVLNNREKLLLLAATAGRYRVAAGAVRIIPGVGANPRELIRNIRETEPLFVRVALAGTGFPMGGNVVFSISGAASKDANPTQAEFLVDYYHLPALINYKLYVDHILMPGESLFAAVLDATLDLKVTSITVT
jgi:hypothetical protein